MKKMELTKGEQKLLIYLFTHRNLYQEEIRHDLGVSQKTLYNHLQGLIQKGMIKEDVKGRCRYYPLTDLGESFGWALQNPGNLVKLYRAYQILKFLVEDFLHSPQNSSLTNTCSYLL